MSLTEMLQEYIKLLERDNVMLGSNMCKELAQKAKQIGDLNHINSRMAAFKGYEPKFDRQNVEHETREAVIRDLKNIVGGCE